MATAGPEDEQLSQNIRDQFLQCKICLDGLKEPKTLPCLHTFCADCIHYYIGHNRIDDRKFACPICRRHIYIPKSGVDGFPDSFFVTNLNDIVIQSETAKSDDATPSAVDCGICKHKDEKAEAKSMCVECKINLCETCSADHSKAKITESHTLLPVKTETLSNRDNYCRVHKGETIKFYCETCNCPICLPCTFIEHKDHNIVEIKKIQSLFTQEMEGLVQLSADNIMQLESTGEDLVDLENELFVRKETIKSEIRRAVQELVKDIQEQEKKLKAEIDDYYETMAVSRDRHKLERIRFRMRHAHDFATQLLAADVSPISQLINRKEAKQNLTESLQYELPDVTVHHSKLDRYVNFLPGRAHVELGTLLKCSNTKQGRKVIDLPQRMPSSKAMFLHKLRPDDDDYTMGDVISLAFLPNNDVVVLTSDGKKVKVYTMKGQFKLDFGDDDDLQHPSDMTITRDGDVAISDCGSLSVKIFSPFGTLTSQFGSDDVFSLPISLTTDVAGRQERFLVLDQDRQRITIHLSTSGELVKDISVARIQTPQLIITHGCRLYISDFQNDTIHMYSTKDNDVTYVAQLTPHGEKDGHFLDCSGTAVDHHGNLFVADMSVDRLHCVTPDGAMSYIIASGQQFMHPTNIAVSPCGLLAVAQQGSYIMETTEGPDDAAELEEIPQGNHVCLYRLIKAD